MPGRLQLAYVINAQCNALCNARPQQPVHSLTSCPTTCPPSSDPPHSFPSTPHPPIPQAEAASREQLSAFLKEVATLAGLHHRNIVQFYGACLEPGSYFFVTELMKVCVYGGGWVRRRAGSGG